MNIFLDFDDVIFDAKAFSSDLKKTFVASGIPEALFERFYLDYPVKGPDGVRKYNAWEHLELIGKSGEDVSKAEEAVSSFMAGAERYVFGDAEGFIERFQGVPMFLVSYGDDEFQRAKIGKLCSGDSFLECVVSEKKKSEVIAGICERHGIRNLAGGFFIDDRLENIQDVKRKFPEIRTIIMQRPEGRYRDRPDETCDYVAHSLDEARNIIESFL